MNKKNYVISPLLRKEDLGEVKKRVYKIINGEIDGN